MTTARDEILARVRYAAPGAVAPIPRTYRRESSRAGLVERFCERVADYRADVRRVTAEAASDEITSALDRRGASRIGVPPGLPTAWRPPAGVVEDHGLSPAELDTLDGVVTGCEIAIAETGTIVLAGGSRDGRRALTLVPDLHVCVVDEQQIVDVLPQAVSRLDVLVRDERRPLTFVSGPSATSDIELSRVEGVHGPRDLVVVVVA
ncbi:MAG: LutC/YkgG family protein [Gaiellaceae bacterium]